MQEQAPPTRAAIDIGSNTIHIVVARCTADDLDIVADEVEMPRIGDSVTATGEISPELFVRQRTAQSFSMMYSARPDLKFRLSMEVSRRCSPFMARHMSFIRRRSHLPRWM